MVDVAPIYGFTSSTSTYAFFASPKSGLESSLSMVSCHIYRICHTLQVVPIH